jgi:predicted hydrocarbon binding protein
MAGKQHLEMAIEYLTERIFHEYQQGFSPESDGAVDYCRSWIKLMGSQGFLDEQDYIFSEDGDQVRIKVYKSNCSYYDYCTKAREENMIFSCPRMLSCRYIASRFTGKQYQLKIEEISDNNWCYGTIYPDEIITEMLIKDGDKIKMAGDRVVVISVNAYGLLLKTIHDYAPHLLGQVLYESAYYSSAIEYDRVSSYFSDSREIIEHLLRATNRIGNIRYEIIEFDAVNKRAKIRGYGSFMAELFVEQKLFNSPKVSCYSARGRLAAYFTKAWGEEIVCEEMQCEALNNDFCEFILLSRNNAK